MKKLFLISIIAAVTALFGGFAYAETPAVYLGDSMPMFAMAGILVNASVLRDVFTSFSMAFTKGFSKESASHWEKIATRVPSTGSENDYGWLGEFPGIREWVGDRLIKSLELFKYAIKNKEYEGTIGVKKTKIEDDQYGVMSPLFEEMGYAALTHPDGLVFGLLKDGFTKTCFDGQFYFDTDHPVGNEETGIASVSNMQAGAENAWFLLDTNRPLKPLIFQERKPYTFVSMTKDDDESVFMANEFRFGVDSRSNVGFGFWQLAFGSKALVTQQNFDDNFAAMSAFKSDEGRPINVQPSLMVCGPSNRAAAKAVLKAANLANGASNTNFEAVELLVVPWLD